MPNLRSLEDAKSWLSQEFTGTAETGVAAWWRLIEAYRPDIRVVVVRRPVDDVVESLMRLDMRSVCSFDKAVLTRGLRRMDMKLSQIARRMRNVLSVNFDDFADESVCAKVFEHCLPYQHDHEWWMSLAQTNLQADMPALMRHFLASHPALDKLASVAKYRSLTDMSRVVMGQRDGLTFQVEPFAQFFRDAQDLFHAHMFATGQGVNDYRLKNIPFLELMDKLNALQVATARCNGRMVAYIMSVVGPSLDDQTALAVEHMPLFASPDFPGIGLKLTRWADSKLTERGVSIFLGRAGHRGSGPKLGVLWQRLGYEPFGALYRRDLRSAV